MITFELKFQIKKIQFEFDKRLNNFFKIKMKNKKIHLLSMYN